MSVDSVIDRKGTKCPKLTVKERNEPPVPTHSPYPSGGVTWPEGTPVCHRLYHVCTTLKRRGLFRVGEAVGRDGKLRCSSLWGLDSPVALKNCLCLAYVSLWCDKHD